MEGAGKQNANENIWTYGTESTIKLEKCAVRSLTACAAQQTRSSKADHYIGLNLALSDVTAFLIAVFCKQNHIFGSRCHSSIALVDRGRLFEVLDHTQRHHTQ
jgi:hypothetical protein